jgi:hypothetical protein
LLTAVLWIARENVVFEDQSVEVVVRLQGGDRELDACKGGKVPSSIITSSSSRGKAGPAQSVDIEMTMEGYAGTARLQIGL